MKLLTIVAFYQICAIVKGAFWAAAARSVYQPIILSIGTMFATIGLDTQSIRDLSLLNNEESTKDTQKVDIKKNW